MGIVILAVAGAGTTFAVTNLFKSDVPKNQITAGYTTMLQPPESGSPVEHTGLENLSYMAYNLRHESAYTVDSFGLVDAGVSKQNIETYKNYKDGVMVVEDFSFSDLKMIVKSVASQSCFVNERALWRNSPQEMEGSWKGRNTDDSVWQSGAPFNYSYEEYMEVYGLPCDEFSVYVLNEKTVGEWSAVTKNPDGTFTQSFYPTNEAAQYYVRRMKTMGNLGDYPTFSSIELSYTFDANWRILYSKSVEEYQAKSMGITAPCTAVTENTYYYDESRVDLSSYENFFSNYVTTESAGGIETDKELTAIDYLMSAFNPILNGGGQLSLNLDITGENVEPKNIAAKVFASVNLQGLDFVSVNLADLDLDVRAEILGVNAWLNGNTVYLKVKDNYLALPVSSLTSILSGNQDGENGMPTPLATDENEAEGGLLDGILSQIENGVLTVEDTSASLSLPLTLGDINLPLYFAFNIENEEIALDYIAIENVTLGDYVLSARIAYDDGDVLPAITAEEKSKAVDVSGCVQTIADIVKTGSVDLSGEVTLVIDEITAKLTLEEVNIRFAEGLTVFAKAELEVENTVHNLYISYVNDELSIVYGNIGVKVKASEFDDIATAFKAVVDKLSGKVDEASQNGTHEAEQVLSLSAISAIFSTEEINGILNSLTLSGGENGGVAVALKLLSGDVNLTYENKSLGVTLDKLTVSGLQVSLNVTANVGGETVGAMPENISYLGLSQLQTLCDYVLDAYNLVNRSEWNVDYAMSVYNENSSYADYGYIQYNVSGNLQVALAKTTTDEAGETVEKPFEASVSVNVIPTNLAVDVRSYCINITVKDGWLYIKASYYSDETNDNYNPLYMKGELSQMAGIIDTVTTVLGYDLSFIGDILKPFQKLVASEPTQEQAKWVISDMLGGLSVDEKGVTLQVKPDKIYGVEGLENLTLNILRQGEGEEALFSLSLHNIYFATSPKAWLNASLTQTANAVAVVAPENVANYIDISSINTLLNSILDSFLSVTDNKLDLKNGYYFAGTITAEILSYKVNFNVKLNVLYEDGDITINASISGKKQSLIISLIESDFQTLLTLNLSKGSVQMQKTTNGTSTTYRSMTLDEFGKDYWSQISYATNLGSSLSDIVQDQINKPSEDTGIDEKVDVGSYLKGYTYENSAYKVTLNGKNFAKFLGDMSLTFAHDEAGKIKNISGSVSIYVNLSLNLDYENTTKQSGDYSLTMKDVTDNWQKSGYEMSVLTGKNASQNALTGVAEYTGEVTLVNGDDQTTMEVIYGAPMSALNDLENTEEAQFIGWFTAPNGEGERVTAETVDNGFAGKELYAHYIDFADLSYLTFRSDVACSFNGGAESTQYVVPNAIGVTLPTVTKAGYKLLAWAEVTADGYTLVTDDSQLTAGELTSKTYYAVWVKDSVAINITEGKRSWGLWTIKGTYAGGGFADGKSMEIAQALNASESAQVIYKLSKDGVTVSDTLKSETVSGGTFSKGSMSSWNCATGSYYGGATVQVTYTLAGVSVTVENTAYNN